MQIAAAIPVSSVTPVSPTRARPEEADAGNDPEDLSGEQRVRAVDDAADRRGPLELSEVEQALVQQLRLIDRAVRAHELAHVAAGGRYVTKPASYQYEVGPDGRRYAVGGEVTIDTSVPSDPEEALAKAQIIERAALAPVDPSPQDYQVAAKARQMATDARRELAAERIEGLSAGPDREPQDEKPADSSPPVSLALATEESLAPVSRFSLFA